MDLGANSDESNSRGDRGHGSQGPDGAGAHPGTCAFTAGSKPPGHRGVRTGRLRSGRPSRRPVRPSAHQYRGFAGDDVRPGQRRGWRGRAVPGAMGAPERLPAAWRSIPAHLRGFGSGHHRRRPSAAQPAGRIPVLGLSARGRPAAGACRRVPPQDPRRGHRPARRWLRAGAGKRCQAGSRLCLSDHGPRLPQAQCRRPPIPLVRRAAQAGQSEPGVLPVAVSDTRAGADSRHGHGRHTGIRTDRARRHRGLDHRTRRSLRRGRGRRPALPALRQGAGPAAVLAQLPAFRRARHQPERTYRPAPGALFHAAGRAVPSAGTDRSQRRRPAGFPGGRAAPDHPGNGLRVPRRRHVRA